MRVLFATIPVKSHFFPMVPLAWALRTAGHDVRVACQPDFASVITDAGLTAAPVGRDRDPYRLLETADILKAMQETADGVDAWGESPEDAGWKQLVDDYRTTVEDWHRSDNFPLIAGLVDLAREWRPDLVVWEPITYAGAVAAKACGAAHARLMNTSDTFGVTRQHFLRLAGDRAPGDRPDPLGEWLGSYARKYGGDFTEDMVTGHFTIDHFPDFLGRKAQLDYVPMRWVPYGGAGPVPRWLWTPPAVPRVAVTLGHFAAEHFGGFVLDVHDILDALADLDIEVVATIGAAQRDPRRAIPDNVRALPWVPLEPLLRTCAAVVHHAGGSTLSTATSLGVPQLLTPWQLSETAMARRLDGLGAAITVDAAQADAGMLRDSVLRLLSEPEIRDRAAALAGVMQAMPSPVEAVARIEELTAKHR